MIFGTDARRLANTTCAAMLGVPAETQVMAFDLAGFCVSAGSACSSGKVQASPVLLAMDIDPVWLGIMIALNLQTSFLTPPFGFALFYQYQIKVGS